MSVSQSIEVKFARSQNLHLGHSDRMDATVSGVRNVDKSQRTYDAFKIRRCIPAI